MSNGTIIWQTVPLGADDLTLRGQFGFLEPLHCVLNDMGSPCGCSAGDACLSVLRDSTGEEGHYELIGGPANTQLGIGCCLPSESSLGPQVLTEGPLSPTQAPFSHLEVGALRLLLVTSQPV